MSTQLILYPQSYKGEFNSTSPLNQFIVNGINFTGFNSSTNYNTTANTPSTDAIANSSPSILGAWYRYTTTGGSWGNVPPPLDIAQAGIITFFYTAAPTGRTGIYQQLSGLVVGAVYDVEINLNTIAAGGVVTIEFYSGNTMVSTQQFASNVSQITTTFTAQSTNDTFLIDYEGTSAFLEVESISLIRANISTSQIYTELQDGQVICDLYQEEDIPLTLSIDDFKNVAEKVQSYSKDFNLPATKRNNQIFNNMFEVTRTDDSLIFNPYVKTKCVLKQDGFILFEGYLRMLDAKDKEGEISYNVNLYSEVVALADILKDSTFSDLDFTELTHEYNKTQIKYSWNDAGTGITYINPNTSGFRDAYSTLKYPFIDWTHQYLIGGTGSGSAATAGNPELTSLEQAFRPCIQLKYLINKIFAASGFNYTSDFFDSADFGKLYMDFNWGADNNPVQSSSTADNSFYCSGGQGTHYAGTSYTNFVLDNTGLAFFVFPPNYNDGTNVITATANNETYNIDYSYLITNTDSVTRTVEARYLKNTTEFDYSGVITLAAGASHTYQGNLNISLDTGDTLQAQFKASSAGVVQQAIGGGGISFGTNVIFILGLTNLTTETILQTLRGELGQWDFLKGIMTMFNLITMVDESNPNNLLIESYSEIFINNTRSNDLNDQSLSSRFDGKTHDWTDKIDASQMELKPLTDLNKNTIFQFVEDDDDYVFQVYKNSTTGHLYGSKELDASTSTNGLPTILQGTKEIIAEPFAATVSKSLMSQFPSFIVPSIYSMTDNGDSEGFENSPRIFYDNGIKSTGASYYIPPQNGLSSENQSDFLQFSHLSDIPTVVGSRDFVFESVQLFPGLGSPPTDNLFSIYWQPYFNELYSPDTRTMTLKVNLSPSDVASFKFYDTVFIKSRVFRVNKIDYKPNDLATVEFILIP